MSIEKIRLFVAARVPEDRLTAIDSALREWKGSLSAARWVKLENQHVTLKFLGSTPEERMDAVREVCALAARGHRPAELATDGLGVFPGLRRARVLWVGLDDPAALLASVATDLSDAFEPLGYAAERRAFTPHLTLARFKIPARLDEPLPVLPRSAGFEVATIDLFRSRLHPHGARYEVLESFPLG